ncbi:exonuclease [Aliiroseovarius sp. 2305UL8-7]|uniref:exonuclease n=1 Tax=Aliiroseovarius conchicola TaxID=3121637 RepID=UPI0035282364
MDTVVIFDTEFLVTEGAQARFWCGPHDPDPVAVQIGAVKLGMGEGFPILNTLRIYICAKDRFGNDAVLDPFFSRLTGVTPADIDAYGISLADALEKLHQFTGDDRLWSWGKDELNMLAISCYIEGIAPPLPIQRFGNICSLALKSGMSYEDIKKTRSSNLADYLGAPHPALKNHDALDDALSVTYALRHLLSEGSLTPFDFH